MTFEEMNRRLHGVRDDHDPLTEAVIGAAIEVHRVLGPGLSETLYEMALCRELELRGIVFERQVPIDVMYKGAVIGSPRLDLVVEKQLILELKSVESLHPVFRAQCVTYLRVSKLRVALLINFNVQILRDGIKRVSLTHK